MFRILLVLTCLMVGTTSRSQTIYIPFNGELPKAGTFSRLGPATVVMARLPSDGISFFDKEKGKEYYGFIEVGRDFLQYEIHHRGKGLIVKSIDASAGTQPFKFIGNESGFNVYKRQTLDPLEDIKIKIMACPKRDCIPIMFLEYSKANSKGMIQDVFLMSYEFGRVGLNR